MAGFPDKPSIAALVFFGARYLAVDPVWLTDEPRGALASGCACRIVFDEPDAVIVAITARVNEAGRLRRPAAWLPLPP
jgi:hypothetical protein